MDGGHAGGSAAAVALTVDIVGDAAESDLMRYYGVRLSDVVAGRHAPRHILALLRGLPREARTQAILKAYLEQQPQRRPPSKPDPLHRYVDWDPVTTWLALIAEQIVFSRYEYAQSVSSTRLPKPKPMPIPVRDHGTGTRATSLYALARAAAGLGES